MPQQPMRASVAMIALIGLSAMAAHATEVTDTITGTVNSFNGGVDSGGYFSAAPGTSLLGDTMTFTITYATSGIGVTYTHDANGSVITYTNAAPGSFVESWTIGSTTFTKDMSNGGRIDVDHNGVPSRYDFGGNFSDGFVQQNNFGNYTQYYDGILAQPLSGTMLGVNVYLGFTEYTTSTWIGLSNATASGEIIPTPEPASLAVLSMSLAGLGLVKRRRAT